MKARGVILIWELVCSYWDAGAISTKNKTMNGIVSLQKIGQNPTI